MLRTGVFLFALLLIAVLSWWLNSHESHIVQTPPDTPPQADFFLENFVIHQFNTDGSLKYQVMGTRLSHFPEDDITVITQPVIEMQPPEKPAWRIKGDIARAQNETLDELWLEGDVLILQQHPGFTTELSTARLLIKPQAEWLESPGAVTLKQPQATIVAAGLTGDLAAGHIELSEVKGRYVPE